SPPGRFTGLHASGPRPRVPSSSVSKLHPLKRAPTVGVAVSVIPVAPRASSGPSKTYLVKHCEGQSIPRPSMVTRPGPTTVTLTSAPYVPPRSTYVPDGPSPSDEQPDAHASATHGAAPIPSTASTRRTLFRP